VVPRMFATASTPRVHGHKGDDEVAAAVSGEEHHHKGGDRAEVGGYEKELVHVAAPWVVGRYLPDVHLWCAGFL